MITKEEALSWYVKGAIDFMPEDNALHFTKDDAVNQFDAFYAERFHDEIAHEFLHPLMQYFSYQHLPPHLQEISRPLAELVAKMVRILPMNMETEAFIRKMLEAKDCAVRAKLYKSPAPEEA